MQEETHYSVECHSWNNQTTNRKQRVRIGSVLSGRVHGIRVQILVCNCEHEYLKLVKVTLFENLIDHNLIYDHDKFGCQELINSGMLLINLDILKSYINDRNSFTIEERKNLGLYKKIVPYSIAPQTSLNIHDSIVNASLDSDMNILQYKEETSFTIPTNISDLSSLNTPVTQHEGTNTHSEVQLHDRKDKIYRKVMDETTLRIFSKTC